MKLSEFRKMLDKYDDDYEIVFKESDWMPGISIVVDRCFIAESTVEVYGRQIQLHPFASDEV